MDRLLYLGALSYTLLLASASVARAQLVDQSQVSPVVPGGAVARSLVDQVGAGHGDDWTWGSSVYLVRRDPAPLSEGARSP